MATALAAPDKFRGTASASQVAAAVARAAARVGWECDQAPVADGGEGLLDAFGGPNRSSTVTGPLGAPVEAPWRLDGDRAVVEMAMASGLLLAGGADGNDPLGATTAGTGELVVAAIEAGARTVIVGAGGSATTDGGLGAVTSIGSRARLAGVRVVVACDVDTRFADAATVFAPQKGASPAQAALLRGRLERLAQVYEAEHGIDVAGLSGSGAAGGLAGGLAALGAELVRGFDVVAEHLRLEDRMANADAVVTGEGLLDDQSFAGKAVGEVVRLAQANDVAVLVVAGEALPEGRAALADAGVTLVELISGWGVDQAMRDPCGCVEDAVGDWLTATPVA